MTSRLATGLVAAGGLLQVLLWLQRVPLWGDEAMLALGVLRTGWGDLLHPLPHAQVAPLGYLVLLKASASVLGPGELALRLPSLLAGLLTLVLLGRVVLAIGDRGAVLAALVLAGCSATLLRYSAQVKPYEFDALFAVVIPYIVVRLGHEDCRRPRWMVGFWTAAMVTGSLAAPVLVGGLVAAIAVSPALRARLGWKSLVAIVLLAASGYLALHAGVYRENLSTPRMTGFWGAESFLTLWRPDLVEHIRHALRVVATLLPSFAPLPGEFRTLLLAGAGILLVRGPRGFRVALWAPCLLTIGISALGVYPFAPRLVLFMLVPLLFALALICSSLAGTGVAERRRSIVVLLVLCAAALPGLVALPFVTSSLRILVAALGVVLLSPRLPQPVRPVLPAGLALVMAWPHAVNLIRNPVQEDGRETIARILAVPRSAVYIPAGSAPNWLYYSSSWESRDLPRVDWYLHHAARDASTTPVSGPGARVWREDGRTEILGTLSGAIFRYPDGYITSPVAGWAGAEAQRVNEAAGDELIIVEFPRVRPAASDSLLGALGAAGWRIDSTRREESAVATFLRRNPRNQ